MQADVVVVAAGRGLRFGGSLPKQFLPLAGKPILAHTIAAFEMHPQIRRIVVVGEEDWLFYIATDIVERFGFEKIYKIVSGGAERQDSVAAGVTALEADDAPVLIHDGARPLVSAALIDRVLDWPAAVDGCIPALSSPDTIKEIDQNRIKRTIPRDSLRLVQTPQGFGKSQLLSALQQATSDALYATDDAALIEHYGGTVCWVEGERQNIKITTEFDIKIATLILQEQGRCA